jgi:hypothetical protein
MTSRKRPGVAFWATVLLVVVACYVVSSGPAFWIASRIGGEHAGNVVYAPLRLIYVRSPQPVQNAMDWWLGFGAAAHVLSLE